MTYPSGMWTRRLQSSSNGALLLLLLLHLALAGAALDHRLLLPSRLRVMPVLHNLLPSKATEIYDALPSRIQACTVSFRHPEAAAALLALSETHARRQEQSRIQDSAAQTRTTRTLGASSIVSERHCLQARDAGASFLSTMFYSHGLIAKASSLSLPVLVGVQSKDDVVRALDSGDVCTGLKFYPASSVSPQGLAAMLAELGLTTKTLDSESGAGSADWDGTPVTRITTTNAASKPSDGKQLPAILMAGGITPDNFQQHMHAGATGIAVGVDCQRLCAADVTALLERFLLAVDAL